jgi:hypothetical protein
MQPTLTRFAASWLLFLLLFVLLLVPPAAQAYQPAGKFQTEAQAKTRCPTDVVVWLNLASRLYYPKGHLWYATSKGGAFVCRKEADEEGNRPG